MTAEDPGRPARRPRGGAARQRPDDDASWADVVGVAAWGHGPSTGHGGHVAAEAVPEQDTQILPSRRSRRREQHSAEAGPADGVPGPVGAPADPPVARPWWSAGPVPAAPPVVPDATTAVSWFGPGASEALAVREAPAAFEASAVREAPAAFQAPVAREAPAAPEAPLFSGPAPERPAFPPIVPAAVDPLPPPAPVPAPPEQPPAPVPGVVRAGPGTRTVVDLRALEPGPEPGRRPEPGRPAPTGAIATGSLATGPLSTAALSTAALSIGPLATGPLGTAPLTGGLPAVAPGGAGPVTAVVRRGPATGKVVLPAVAGRPPSLAGVLPTGAVPVTVAQRDPAPSGPEPAGPLTPDDVPAVLRRNRSRGGRRDDGHGPDDPGAVMDDAARGTGDVAPGADHDPFPVSATGSMPAATQDPPARRRRSERSRGEVPAEPRKAGRNLPAAVAVGLLLGGAVIASLVFRKEAFVGLVSAAVVVAVWELSTAFAAKAISIPVPPLAVGAVGMLVSAFVSGPPGLLVAFTLTAFGVLLYRIIEGFDGAVRDVGAGVFTAAYVPFLAGFSMLLLSADDGPQRVVVFILVTVCNDVGGYAAGVLLGRHPMAPTVSPKKSWEGFGGSVVLCCVAAVAAVVLLLDGPWWAGVAVGVATAVSATLGDLSESLLKRDLGVKDMGSLLPGHGGIMDRLDSLLPTAPVVYLVLTLLVPPG